MVVGCNVWLMLILAKKLTQKDPFLFSSFISRKGVGRLAGCGRGDEVGEGPEAKLWEEEMWRLQWAKR